MIIINGEYQSQQKQASLNSIWEKNGICLETWLFVVTDIFLLILLPTTFLSARFYRSQFFLLPSSPSLLEKNFWHVLHLFLCIFVYAFSFLPLAFGILRCSSDWDGFVNSACYRFLLILCLHYHHAYLLLCPYTIAPHAVLCYLVMPSDAFLLNLVPSHTFLYTTYLPGSTHTYTQVFSILFILPGVSLEEKFLLWSLPRCHAFCWCLPYLPMEFYGAHTTILLLQFLCDEYLVWVF